MIYTPKNSVGKKLVDAKGVVVPYAFEFNDETCEVKFYATDLVDNQLKVRVENGQVVKCRTVIPGARMVPR